MWRALRIIGTVISFAVVVGSLALWWVTNHVDRNGHIPQPAAALRLPGGFLQAVGMPDGLHGMCMLDGRGKVSIQFERATYLGNAGYHTGTVASFGGFTVAVLTKTADKTDNIVSPYAAVVLPYWFLIVVFGFAFLCLSGLVRLEYCRCSPKKQCVAGKIAA